MPSFMLGLEEPEDDYYQAESAGGRLISANQNVYTARGGRNDSLRLIGGNAFVGQPHGGHADGIKSFQADLAGQQQHQLTLGFAIITIILGSIVVCTFVGNLFVIVAILIDKNLQTSANQLVLSLAVADLMVACLVMPLGAYNDIHQGWYLGKEICEFWTSADVLCCTASILNLLAIAIDRYWAVTNVDYIYKRTKKRVSLMILCAWTVGAIVSLAPIFGWKDPDFARRVVQEHKCLVSQDVAYQIFATISTFYAPLVLLLALYWRIFQVARKRIRCKPGARSAPTPSAAGLANNSSRRQVQRQVVKCVGASTDAPGLAKEQQQYRAALTNPAPETALDTRQQQQQHNTNHRRPIDCELGAANPNHKLDPLDERRRNLCSPNRDDLLVARAAPRVVAVAVPRAIVAKSGELAKLVRQLGAANNDENNEQPDLGDSVRLSLVGSRFVGGDTDQRPSISRPPSGKTRSANSASSPTTIAVGALPETCVGGKSQLGQQQQQQQLPQEEQGSGCGGQHNQLASVSPTDSASECTYCYCYCCNRNELLGAGPAPDDDLDVDQEHELERGQAEVNAHGFDMSANRTKSGASNELRPAHGGETDDKGRGGERPSSDQHHQRQSSDGKDNICRDDHEGRTTSSGRSCNERRGASPARSTGPANECCGCNESRADLGDCPATPSVLRDKRPAQCGCHCLGGSFSISGVDRDTTGVSARLVDDCIELKCVHQDQMYLKHDLEQRSGSSSSTGSRSGSSSSDEDDDDEQTTSQSGSLSASFPPPMDSRGSVVAPANHLDSAKSKPDQEAAANEMQPLEVEKLDITRGAGDLGERFWFANSGSRSVKSEAKWNGDETLTNVALIEEPGPTSLRVSRGQLQTRSSGSWLSSSGNSLRPSTGRALDIRRKFRALGQIVSFVQTSRQFNSSSSAPTSQSGDDNDADDDNDHQGDRDHDARPPAPIGHGRSGGGGPVQGRLGRASVAPMSSSDVGGGPFRQHLYGAPLGAASDTLRAFVSGLPGPQHGAPKVRPVSATRKSVGASAAAAVATTNGCDTLEESMSKVLKRKIMAMANRADRHEDHPGASKSSLARTTSLATAPPASKSASTTTPPGTTNTIGSSRQRREHLDIKREKKAAKTLAIISGVFVCCWLPFFLNAILMPVCGPACTPSDLVLSVLLWLGYLNSLLNPIIYTIFSPDFRRAFNRLLCLPQVGRLLGLGPAGAGNQCSSGATTSNNNNGAGQAAATGDRLKRRTRASHHFGRQ